MIRFASFPDTELVPAWAVQIADIFRLHESAIGTEELEQPLASDAVLAILADDLRAAGFSIEKRTLADQKSERSVLLRDSGSTEPRYKFDVYHPGWHCGLSIEAPHTEEDAAALWDVVEPLVVVDADTLCMAVPNISMHGPEAKQAPSRDFDNACTLAATVYGHIKVGLPRRLLLIGY